MPALSFGYSNLSKINHAGYIDDANTANTILVIFNGWSQEKKNAPSWIDNGSYLLITQWIWPSEIGSLSSGRMQIMIGNTHFATRVFDVSLQQWTSWI